MNVPPTVTTGEPFQVTIKAIDDSGYRLASFNREIYISTTAGPLNPKHVRLINGQVTFSAITSDIGDLRLQVYDPDTIIHGESQLFTSSSSSGVSCYGDISGQIVDLRNDVVWDAEVTLYDSSDNQVDTYRTTTDGEFYFDNYACGTYSLNVSKNFATKFGVECNIINGQPCVQDIRLGINEGTQGTPVIILPGILGSSTTKKWNIQPTMTTYAPQDARDLYIHGRKTTGLEPLKERLQAQGYTVIDCPWDWRMSIHDAAEEYLIPKISEALDHSTTGKVHVVAHSMGGLVTRAYIQGEDYKQDIDRFAMVGTPNQGSLNPYYIWQGGDPKLIDDITDTSYNFYSNSLQNIWEDAYRDAEGLPEWDNWRHL